MTMTRGSASTSIPSAFLPKSPLMADFKSPLCEDALVDEVANVAAIVGGVLFLFARVSLSLSL